MYTYQEANLYGFMQTRVTDEVTLIEKQDFSLPLKFEDVLNPSKASYSLASEFLTVDTEFDQMIPCRVTIISLDGSIVLDTLVKQDSSVYHRMIEIHGITTQMLADAPSLENVRKHIIEICAGKVFIGHGVKQDMKVLGIFNFEYVDTQKYYGAE